jgi:hypothetical protein
MSIFGDIMATIFGGSAKAETPAPGTGRPATPTGGPVGAPAGSPSIAPVAPKPAAPVAQVDVAAFWTDSLSKRSRSSIGASQSLI